MKSTFGTTIEALEAYDAILQEVREMCNNKERLPEDEGSGTEKEANR